MLTSALTILLSVFVLLCLLLYFFQGKLIYYPDKHIAITPSDVGLEHEELFLKTANGKQIHAWLIEHQNAKAHVIFFHGNAGNISHRLDTIRFLHELQLSTLIIDYQGYGKSEGTASEQNSYNDALAAWDFLVTEKQLQSDEIILFGRSLGGAIASWLGKEKQPKLVILESTFISVSEIGKEVYPFLPIKWLTRIQYNNEKNIKLINSPVLVVHSQDDKLIPHHHGKRLYDVANEPKAFYELKGGHNDGFFLSMDDYKKYLMTFLESHL